VAREQEAASVTGAFTGAGGGVGHESVSREHEAAAADLVAADRSGRTNRSGQRTTEAGHHVDHGQRPIEDGAGRQERSGWSLGPDPGSTQPAIQFRLGQRVADCQFRSGAAVA
jgi:hypothetical protein